MGGPEAQRVSHLRPWPAGPSYQAWGRGGSEEHEEVEGRLFLEWKNVTHTCEQNVITHYLRL